MTPDEFRKHGHRVVDWIADYYEQLETFPGAVAIGARLDPGRTPGPRRPSRASRSTRYCATWTT